MPYITFLTRLYFIISIFNICCRSTLYLLSLEHAEIRSIFTIHSCRCSILQNRRGPADILFNQKNKGQAYSAEKTSHIRDPKFGSKQAADSTLGSIVLCGDTKHSLCPGSALFLGAISWHLCIPTELISHEVSVQQQYKSF